VRLLPDAVAWRARQSGPVVFTNGVFDLIHPGHVQLLEAARSEGSALIVGINSDASVRRLGKGTERPLMPEAARARVVAALASVDCVVLFEGDTPLELIQALAPDVLVKGADYLRAGIVGGDWIEARGGRVVRVPLVSGFSTTSLVERLRASS
jgi:D-beta-D-heptose 7-phosphate kinase/D-beta-D-heptose 1-phosphate adenosyltransferase